MDGRGIWQNSIGTLGQSVCGELMEAEADINDCGKRHRRTYLKKTGGKYE